MVYGDTLAGCRFNSCRELKIEDDVWFVCHCLVSPIHAEPRSLAMLGSLVIKNMMENHCYAGVPAIDVTEKVGPQFQEVSLDKMASELECRIKDFKQKNSSFSEAKIGISTISADMLEGKDYQLVFNVADRTYTKKNSALEMSLIRHLLPRAKFIPSG
jgi:hypothetical protein